MNQIQSDFQEAQFSDHQTIDLSQKPLSDPPLENHSLIPKLQNEQIEESTPETTQISIIQENYTANNVNCVSCIKKVYNVCHQYKIFPYLAMQFFLHVLFMIQVLFIEIYFLMSLFLLMFYFSLIIHQQNDQQVADSSNNSDPNHNINDIQSQQQVRQTNNHDSATAQFIQMQLALMESLNASQSSDNNLNIREEQDVMQASSALTEDELQQIMNASNVKTQPQQENQNQNQQSRNASFNELLRLIQANIQSRNNFNQRNQQQQNEDGGMTGLSKTRIKSLPLWSFKEQQNDKLQNRIGCSICWDEFVEGQSIRMLPCTHNFHDVCVNQWLEIKNSCPNCKEKVF